MKNFKPLVVIASISLVSHVCIAEKIEAETNQEESIQIQQVIKGDLTDIENFYIYNLGKLGEIMQDDQVKDLKEHFDENVRKKSKDGVVQFTILQGQSALGSGEVAIPGYSYI